MAAQVLALTQGGRHGEQQLGQVAADLALDPDRHHDPPEVAALHPLGDALQGVLDGHAEPALDHDPPELAGDRLGALADDRVDGLREGEAGREAAGHQLQGVGQARPEGLQRGASSSSSGRASGPTSATTTISTPRTMLPAPRSSPSSPPPTSDGRAQQQPLRRLECDSGGLEALRDPRLHVLVVGQGLLGRLPRLPGERVRCCVVGAGAGLPRDGHHAVGLDLLRRG